MESSTNSPVGGHHWYNTLLGFVSHVGEALKKHGVTVASEDTIKAWGSTLESHAKELIAGFAYINQPSKDQVVLLNKYEIVNRCENGLQLKIAILSLGDTEGMIQGRKRPFKAARMAGFVEGVIAGELPPECLTREFGIRQQALYIKYYEDNEKENKS